MAKNFDMMEDSNRSGNPSIHGVSMPGRRVVIQDGLAALLSGVPAPWLASCTSIGTSGPLLGFKGIAAGAGDTLVVPEGYVAEAIAAWGEPVGIAGAMPAWAPDASRRRATSGATSLRALTA